MSKKIILAIVVIVAILYLIMTKASQPNLGKDSAEKTAGVLRIEAPELNISPITFDDNGNVSADAWLVLQKYLNFAKYKNIDGLKNVSQQISSFCRDYSLSEENKKECDARMDTVYQIGSTFSEKDFSHISFDKKQIILSTDYRYEENDTLISRNRAIIFFVIDNSGFIKLLSFNAAKGAILQKNSGPVDELKKKLITLTEDKDEDGLEDYLENCLSASQNESCVKTDPAKKDTNGDGIWDGIENQFYK